MVSETMLNDLGNGLIFVMDGSASIFIFYLIMQNILVHKVYTLPFWLLVFLELAVVFIIITNALLFKIFLDGEDGSTIFQDNPTKMNRLLITAIAFAGLNTAIFNCVHWIFALKYWSVACKLQFLQNRDDPDKFVTTYTIIYYVGLIINILTGLFQALFDLGHKRSNGILSIVFQIGVIFSCGFLGDAFRRLKMIQNES